MGIVDAVTTRLARASLLATPAFLFLFACAGETPQAPELQADSSQADSWRDRHDDGDVAGQWDTWRNRKRGPRTGDADTTVTEPKPSPDPIPLPEPEPQPEPTPPPAPVAEAVTLTPGSVSIESGSNYQFTAAVRMSDGSTADTGVTWAATGGTVNATGRYTAGNTAGTYRVIARAAAGRLADTARIEIPAPPPPPSTAACPSSGYSRLVSVSTASQLTNALSDARPGDQIRLADGTYGGRFKPRAKGTASQPITLCGSANAVLSDATSGGYTLGPDGAEWWVFRGFTIDRGLKGIMADRSNDNLFERLTVKNIAGECVHLRNFSSRNIVRDNYIHHCGVSFRYGEGIYIGSSPNNLDNDLSNQNQALDNRIEDTASDAIDMKESSRGHVIRGNYARRTGNGTCSLNGNDCSSSANTSAVISGRPTDTTIECNDLVPSNGVSYIVSIYSGNGGDYNRIAWNMSGSVSVNSAQVGNQVSTNTPQGYSANCS